MVTTLGQKNIGDTVRVPMASGNYQTFYVVQKGIPASTNGGYSSSISGGVFLLQSGAWKYGTDWPGYSHNGAEFIATIDSKVQEKLVEFTVPGQEISGSNALRKAFVLSGCEVGLQGESGISTNGGRFAYFEAGMAPQTALDRRISIYANTWIRNSYSGVNGIYITSDGKFAGNYGGSSAYTKFAIVLPSSMTVTDAGAVTTNQPPVISGSNEDLGVKSAPFTQDYTVEDPDGDMVTVTEKVNDMVLRTFSPEPEATNTLSIPEEIFRMLPNEKNTITVTVTDGIYTVTRTWTFTKEVTTGFFTLNPPLEADAMPIKGIVNILGEFPPGCELKIEACNNGNDEIPVWQDITDQALGNRKFFFENTEKTAGDWGVNLRVSLNRWTAEGRCHITGIGGNFE